MTIYFYSTREQPYGCFSNFSRHGFELDGAYYKTSEHYFQIILMETRAILRARETSEAP